MNRLFNLSSKYTGLSQISPFPVFSFSFLALLPVLQVNLLTWLLLAVIAGIILIYILITFILLPLSRRSNKLPPPPAHPPVVDADVSQVAGPQSEATVAVSPPLPQPQVVTPPPVPGVITVPESGQRPDGIRWHIAGLTDVGLKRELNEDNLMMIEAASNELGPYGLYIVADGLGGHEAGEVASQITIDTIKHHHHQHPPSAPPFNDWFTEAIVTANNKVLAYQENHKEAEKMGSTLVMALVAGNMAHIANVGDSRAYHLTNSAINQISVDHSLVERLVQIGQITREEARTHKQRNVVYSIIGEKRRLEVGQYDIALSPGDRLLLCSDGLSGMVTDEALLQINQNEADPARATRQMIEAAKQAGGHDNITAILIQMN